MRPRRALSRPSGRATGGPRAGARSSVGSGPADLRSASPTAVDERDAQEVDADAQREREARTHPRAALVIPADRHDGDPVAAAPGEVDELDVEDDARDLLLGEQLPGGVTGEPLEPALGVLD